MHLAPIRIWIILCSLLTSLSLATASRAAEQFPVFDNITANVDFWTKVYTEYSTTQAIVHDSKDLNIIYAVIDLQPYENAFARKINRQRMKRAKKKYEHILKRLAADPNSGNPEYRRVAELFGPQSTARTFRTASDRVRCQIGQSDRFKLGLIRSGAYIDQIRSIFRSYDLPEELAYLPHVESSFNTKAYSKFGAAGIWQFTRSTGRRFMKVGYVLDERRDPFLATHAAASLLKENFQKLGSWPLAITAYNHGASGMERARSKYGSYPAIFESYHSRTFKFASRNFYSEFIAAYQIASDYRNFFGDIALDRPAQFQTVALNGFAGFEKLCAHFGVSPETARSLNPALRPPVFDGQKLVPIGYPFRLPANLELAAVPSSLLDQRQRPSRFYTVQRGDTAGKIARLNGVKLADLILANNLDRRAVIYPRQTLRIPLPGEAFAVAQAEPRHESAASVVLAANDAEPTAASDPEPGDELPAAVEPSGTVIAAMDSAEPTGNEEEIRAAAEADAGGQPLVTPQPAGNDEAAAETAPPDGDESLDAVAEAETADDLTASTVLADNTDEAPEPVQPAGMSASEPDPGASDLENQTYPQPVLASMIPTAALVASIREAAAGVEKSEPPPSIEIVGADVRFEKTVAHGKRTVGILQVEIEETLGHYAEWADVRTQQIRRLNGLPFGQTLHLHQKIKIPLTKKTAREFEESRYEYHKRLQEDFFAVYRVSEIQPYRVGRGDNLWTLCLGKFDIPMWLLKNCNPEVDFADLRPHQKIMVPVIEKYTPDDPGLPSDQEPDQDETKSTEDLS